MRVVPDTILVATDAGLFSVEGDALKLLDGNLRGRRAARTFTVEGKNGDRWFASWSRLYRNGQLVYEGDFPISDIRVDGEGSVWVASDGLRRFKPSVFQVLGPEDGAIANVYPIYEDARRRIWVGCCRTNKWS